MIEVRIETVYSRVPARDRLTTLERVLIWRTITVEGVTVRRTLIEAATGEVLDDAWLDESGRVCSYSVPRSARLDPPDGRYPAWVEAVVPAASRADDRVVEHGRDDRALTG